eukprot:XP_020397171.1 predicted GPI-anchored protein 58 [Zea mays]
MALEAPLAVSSSVGAPRSPCSPYKTQPHLTSPRLSTHSLKLFFLACCSPHHRPRLPCSEAAPRPTLPTACPKPATERAPRKPSDASTNAASPYSPIFLSLLEEQLPTPTPLVESPAFAARSSTSAPPAPAVQAPAPGGDDPDDSGNDDEDDDDENEEEHVNEEANYAQ